ncbi:hypothetical protein OP853_004856 [Salmonella enterica]|nr:hypothetical protein [Salmonella enterica]EKC7222311.1 hypothetical protein [Salmonella enterica]
MILIHINDSLAKRYTCGYGFEADKIASELDYSQGGHLMKLSANAESWTG